VTDADMTGAADGRAEDMPELVAPIEAEASTDAPPARDDEPDEPETDESEAADADDTPAEQPQPEPPETALARERALRAHAERRSAALGQALSHARRHAAKAQLTTLALADHVAQARLAAAQHNARQAHTRP
jgi:hypothetical protein